MRKLAYSGVAVALLLLAAPQHLSAEQILASLRAAGARVSKATVYNTLNLFAARGLIRQLSVDGSRAWFDSNVIDGVVNFAATVTVFLAWMSGLFHIFIRKFGVSPMKAKPLLSSRPTCQRC